MTAPSYIDKQGVTAAVRLVRIANRLLWEATYRLDEGGYSCPTLNDISSDTAALLAAWAGRDAPTCADPPPAWIGAAARDWRRANNRSY